jgi:hypothetical protein
MPAVQCVNEVQKKSPNRFCFRFTDRTFTSHYGTPPNSNYTLGHDFNQHDKVLGKGASIGRLHKPLKSATAFNASPFRDLASEIKRLTLFALCSKIIDSELLVSVRASFEECQTW